MKLAIVCDHFVFLKNLLRVIEKEYSIADIDVYEDLNGYQNCGRYHDALLADIDTIGLKGLKCINSHPQPFTYIIYLAMNRNYMEDAYGVNVLGYVLKNQIEDKIYIKLQKIRNLMQIHKIYELKSERQLVRVPEYKMMYCYLEDGFMYLELDHEKRIRLSYRTLIELKNILSSRFWRINRNCIVNKDKIIAIDHARHEIKLINGHSFHVSRREWVQFKKSNHTTLGEH